MPDAKRPIPVDPDPQVAELKGCGHGVEEPHICPYQYDINNDSSLCTCCEGCQWECAKDI